jgi:hypothetical protein
MCIAMRKEYIFYVYFMISSSRRALYLGMTSGLRNRVAAQKQLAFGDMPQVRVSFLDASDLLQTNQKASAKGTV